MPREASNSKRCSVRGSTQQSSAQPETRRQALPLALLPLGPEQHSAAVSETQRTNQAWLNLQLTALTLLPLGPDEHLAVLARAGKRVHGQPKVRGPRHIPHPVCARNRPAGIVLRQPCPAKAGRLPRGLSCAIGSALGNARLQAGQQLLHCCTGTPGCPPVCPVSVAPSCCHCRACSFQIQTCSLHRRGTHAGTQMWMLGRHACRAARTRAVSRVPSNY